MTMEIRIPVALVWQSSQIEILVGLWHSSTDAARGVAIDASALPVDL